MRESMILRNLWGVVGLAVTVILVMQFQYGLGTPVVPDSDSDYQRLLRTEQLGLGFQLVLAVMVCCWGSLYSSSRKALLARKPMDSWFPALLAVSAALPLVIYFIGGSLLWIGNHIAHTWSFEWGFEWFGVQELAINGLSAAVLFISGAFAAPQIIKHSTITANDPGSSGSTGDDAASMEVSKERACHPNCGYLITNPGSTATFNNWSWDDFSEHIDRQIKHYASWVIEQYFTEEDSVSGAQDIEDPSYLACRIEEFDYFVGRYGDSSEQFFMYISWSGNAFFDRTFRHLGELVAGSIVTGRKVVVKDRFGFSEAVWDQFYCEVRRLVDRI